MQTPKSKTSSLEVPQRKSPTTLRTARQLKIPGSDSDPVSSPHRAGRMPKEKSPKVIDRKSPRSPASERKRPSRVSELESQLAHLQEELKKTKDELNSAESLKRQAQQDAEETTKQLSDMSAKLEESQQQLLELSASEDDRVQELRKISQDRDRAWESEIEAIQKQHSMDTAALASAMNEIQKLKLQLEMVSESEAAQSKQVESAHSEIEGLRVEISDTLSLVENLKSELNDSKESEAQAQEIVKKAQMNLETANKTMETLRSDASKATQAYNSLLQALEQSKSRVISLEGIISKFQSDLANGCRESLEEHADDVYLFQENNGGNEEINKLREEVNSMRSEVNQLKSALDASERRYQEEYIQSTLQIRSAYEQVEHTKSEASRKEAELKNELITAKAYIEKLRVDLLKKEAELHNISENNENDSEERGPELAIQMKKSETDVAELKASLLDKETVLQSITEENETLKMEIQREKEKNKGNDEAVALAEAARAAEQEALMKLNHATEEANKNGRRAARATEQLDAAQATNNELETELRRLKVQADQLRKAAEAAAAMLSNGNNGKFVDRTGSLDSNYPLGSPYSEDLYDHSPKKKNANMLKKIGVLWKKGQK